MSASRRMVIVSNRLPVSIEECEGKLRAKPSDGGLVTALLPIMRKSGGCWVGWTGADYDPATAAALDGCAPDNCSFVPVFLSAAEKGCFYYGCCNEVIWPLFHSLPTRCKFDPAYWSAYSEVTEKFADAVERIWRNDDFVWVHDYHLMMLADAIRERGLRTRMAYFQHIPFPAPEIFETLPWRSELLRALLQFQVLGFQMARDRRNFIACVRHCLSDVHVRSLGDKLLVCAEGRSVTAGVYPISIDFDEFAGGAATPEVTAAAERLQQAVGGTSIILGVDRLDYTKGIPERLQAFATLLATDPDLRGRVTLLQVVIPSREAIPEYRDLKLGIERQVSQINGEYGAADWVPVHYLYRSISRSELLAFYRAARVAAVTPLKDGMNLVAKEFCASRVDQRGVLVLSEFAGAAEELAAGAVVVNPYDVEGVASALHLALHMEERDQRMRMQAMQAVIRTHDVYHWARRFCAQATSLKLVPARATLSLPWAAAPRRQVAAAD